MSPTRTSAEARPPLLSIVTVSFNAGSTIERTLTTVDALLGKDAGGEIEHIIIDGASKDSTLAIVRARSHPRRRLFSEPDRGLYDAMNKGLSAGAGRYIWFLNADDHLHPAILARPNALLTELRANAGDLVVGEIEMFRVRGGHEHSTRYWAVPRRLVAALRWSWHPPHPAFIAKTALLRELGGFDETKRIAADFKLMTLAMRTSLGRTILLSQPLVRMLEGGVSNRSVRAILRANRECYSALREIGDPPPRAAAGIAMKLLRKSAQRLHVMCRQAMG
jgi:glycosyltransferase involved in cell wall biosynthesis